MDDGHVRLSIGAPVSEWMLRNIRMLGVIQLVLIIVAYMFLICAARQRRKGIEAAETRNKRRESANADVENPSNLIQKVRHKLVPMSTLDDDEEEEEVEDDDDNKDEEASRRGANLAASLGSKSVAFFSARSEVLSGDGENISGGSNPSSPIPHSLSFYGSREERNFIVEGVAL